MIRALILSAALLAPWPAFAHNVLASVFPSGQAIEGEIGLSDGTMAANALVEVFDASGNKLGETTTDEDGFFLFTPTQPVTHVFRSNLGAGHVAQTTLDGEEVADILGLSQTQPAASASVLGGAPESGAMLASANAGLSDQARTELADMLRRELRPLRQELTALRTEQTFQSILGGIGYICGLFGLGFYLAARRKLKEAVA